MSSTGSDPEDSGPSASAGTTERTAGGSPSLDDGCDADVNPLQEDFDLDGVGDICDVCPSVSDPDQHDSDSDGVGDACPPTPPTGPADYVLDYPVLTSGITGFRLEALVDPSLPATGPGWAGNGNFILNEIEITDDAPDLNPRISIPLANPQADYEQSGRPASLTLDGSLDPNLGWSVDVGGTARTLTVETLTDFDSADAITVRLYNRYVPFDYRLGRFRLAYTTDARGTFGPASGNWTVLDSNLGGFADSLSKSTATAQVDGGWLVAPGDSNLADYALEYRLVVSGITGFRLETMLDPSLPANGPGWAGNGNFQLSEIAVTYVPEPIAVLMLGAVCVLLVGLERRKNRDLRTPCEHGRRIAD